MRAFLVAVAALMSLVASDASIARQTADLTPQLHPKASQVAAASMPVGAPDASVQRQLTKEDVDAWLDGFMPNALASGDVAGAVVVVVKDGAILTKRGFGYSDVAARKPVDPDTTLFRPGSVSKLITWTAVMQQVEAGRINLDADINTYLDFRIPDADGKPVTMRELMTHTAGFEDHAKDLMFYDPKQLDSLGDYLKKWVPKRIFAPGTTPAYSNYGATLAGYIVERVAHQPFDDYVDQHVFAPLGMTHSTFRQPLPAALKPWIAQGYRRASGAASQYELLDPAPAGSLASSGTDMARFMIAHLQNGALNGNRILSAATAQEMHDTPTTIIPQLNRMELGFFESNINGHEVIGHLGDLEVFHTALHLFLKDNVGIYLSVNSAGRNGAAGEIRAALLDDFADRYFPAPRNLTPIDPKLSAEHARMMAGYWRNSRRIESGFMNILNLISQTKVSVGSKGELIIPSIKTPGGATVKWIETAPFVWQDAYGHDKLAAKVVDGRVVRWSYDAVSPFMVFDRVPAALSSGWLLPILYLSIAILFLTFLHWPASALVRWHYRTPLVLVGQPRLAYRGIRVAAGLSIGVLLGWIIAFNYLIASVSHLTSDSDGLLWTLQILGLIAFVGAVLFAGWNLVFAWWGKRRWTGKTWAVLVLIAALVVFYAALNFGLLAMTVNY
jgi:CubicO group peptidase (beta-lactamase class C family)